MQQRLADRRGSVHCSGPCLTDAGFHQWCNVAAVRRCNSSHRQRAPHRLHVSCPAVEQDTEVASTSGRHHSDSEVLHALLSQQEHAAAAAAVLDALGEGVQQQKHESEQQLIDRVQESGSLPLLCELIQAEAHNFTHQVASAALYRLSLLCHAYFTQLQSAHLTSQEAQQAAWGTYVDPALRTLGQLLLQHIGSADPWTVSISLWAYGHLQGGEEAVVEALSMRGMQLLHEFNTVDCASSLVGLAKLTTPRARSQREFVEQLIQHTHVLLDRVHEWTPGTITSVVWALSQLGAAGPARRPLLHGLVEMVLWRLQEFGVKEIVITTYSMGRCGMGRMSAQMAKLTNQVLKRLNEVTPQDAANLVYSCAKLTFKPVELLQKLPAVVIPQLSSFKPQEISNLVYGYGQLQYLHPQLLDAIAKASTPRLHEFSTQDLCMSVWAYGALGYCPEDTSFFEAVCRALLARKERLVPLQITMVLKGFSRSGYQPPPGFMQRMSQLSLAKLSQFSPLEYSQLLWAYAAAGYRDVTLFEAVVAHAIQQLHSKTHTVSKTTVDTILHACQGVGFWPQLLVDTAEMSGLYVKTQKGSEESMQSLATPVSAPVAHTAAAGAAPAGVAEAGGAQHAVGTTAATAGSGSSSSSSSNHAALAGAFAAALSLPVEAQSPQQQQQQHLQQQSHAPQQQQQQQSHALQQQEQAHKQPSRLDQYGLQRPQLPPQRRQQQQQQVGLVHPQQQHQQQQQQQLHGGQPGRLDQPALREQLLPPPALPVPHQHRHATPAAAIETVLYSNGTSSRHSHSEGHQHRSVQHSSSVEADDSGVAQQQQHQEDDGSVLIHPVPQDL